MNVDVSMDIRLNLNNSDDTLSYHRFLFSIISYSLISFFSNNRTYELAYEKSKTRKGKEKRSRLVSIGRPG